MRGFKQYISFYGINFINIKGKVSFYKMFKNGGTYMFPSGPGLAEINDDYNYLKALRHSTYTFFDSGLFVALLNFKKINVQKFSGYLFLTYMFDFLKKKNINSYLLVDPDKKNSSLNIDFMNKNVINSSIRPYIAPIYELFFL